MKVKIFLGGTCNNSTWRDELIPLLEVDYFNPVVEDWTPDCQKEEIRQKEKECDFHLYVITHQMRGVFSIAEAVDSVHNPDKFTILHVCPLGFDEAQLKSLKAVIDLIVSRGGVGQIGNDNSMEALAATINSVTAIISQ